jgi:glycerophosphoryl diester phosphodiesterase
LTPEEFVITSFLPQVVQRVKTLLSSQPKVGLLIEAKAEEQAKGSLLTRCRELGADFLAPHYSWVNLQFLAEAEQAGIPLYVWTVNDPEVMKLCLQPFAGSVGQNPVVQGLITDRPQLALQIRAHLLAGVEGAKP